MNLIFLRIIFCLIQLSLLPSQTWANKAAHKVEDKTRAPVYFPALPEAFSEDFGRRVAPTGTSKAVSKSRPKSNDQPHSPHKQTTTTEKLPLAQESHVFNNAITQAPGPSYLTDSVYYYGDPTPSPASDEVGLQRFSEEDLQDNQGSIEYREREVSLQSVSSFKSRSDENRLTVDPLLNPALLHYIPMNSGESLLGNLEEPAPQPSTSSPPKFEGRIISSTVYKRPMTPPTPAKSIEKPTPETPSSEEPPPVTPSTRYRRPTDVSILDISKSPPTNSPKIRYRPPSTRTPRIIRPRPKTSRKPASNRVQKNGHTKIVKIQKVNPKSNLFENRISRPVVRPFYNHPATKRPTTTTTTTTTTTPTYTTTPKPRRRIETKKLAFSKESLFVSTDSLNDRYQHEPKAVEIYRPPGQEDSEEFFEKYQRDYGFDFDESSGSAAHESYRPPAVVTVKPFEEVPVYRTSTKSYRAPASLFHVQSSEEEGLKDKSHRDFILADSNIYVPEEYNENAIPGIGGVDYPIYHDVPDTDFSCSEQDQPGLYADIDTKCQVFHICQEGGREDSFICPNGTVFNQRFFVCDWWYNFACDHADRFYSLNAFIYELPDKQLTKTAYS